MSSAAVKPFHLPLVAYNFPHINTNINNKKFSSPRISLQALANDDHDHQHIVMKKKKKKKYGNVYEEYIKGSPERIRKIISGEIPHKRERNLVLWDMDTAPLPSPEYALKILGNIRCRLEDRLYFGPVELRAYGDKNKMPSVVWDQLLEGNDGTFTHVPSRGQS